MSAAVVIPLIAEGIRDIFSLFSGHQNNNAAKDAAAITSRSTNAALEYEKAQEALAEQVRQDEQAYQRSQDSLANARLDQTRADKGPYRAAGQGAVTTLSGLLTPGQRVNGATGIQTGADGTQRSLADLVNERSQVQTVQAPVAPPTTPAVSTVKMVAPDGSTMDVPTDRYQEALSKGAKLAPGAVAPVAPSSAGGVSTVQPVSGYGDKVNSADADMSGSTPSGSAMTDAMVDPRPGPNTGMYSNRYIKMTNPLTGETRSVLFANVGDLSSQGWVASTGGGR